MLINNAAFIFTEFIEITKHPNFIIIWISSGCDFINPQEPFEPNWIYGMHRIIDILRSTTWFSRRSAQKSEYREIAVSCNPFIVFSVCHLVHFWSAHK